jgi:hypothetical protein
MPSEYDVASIDAMRDMDEEEGAERLDEERLYRLVLSSTYEVRALSPKDAEERWNNDEAAFCGDDITSIEIVD